jgi:PhnB protein
MAVKPIPDGFATVTPYLVVEGAARALEFYKKAFGAEELFRFDAPGGKVGHAELRIGDSRLMIADEYPEMGFRGPKALGGTPVSLMVYVEDVDTAAKRAVDAGAKVLRPVANQFYGDRSGTFVDPFGHIWTIGTHKEDVPMDELQRRAAAACTEQHAGAK